MKNSENVFYCLMLIGFIVMANIQLVFAQQPAPTSAPECIFGQTKCDAPGELGSTIKLCNGNAWEDAGSCGLHQICIQKDEFNVDCKTPPPPPPKECIPGCLPKWEKCVNGECVPYKYANPTDTPFDE